MQRAIFISCLFILTHVLSHAQERPSYKLFCPDNNYQSYGVFVGLGATQSTASAMEPFKTMAVSATTNYDVEINALGKTGLQGEFGGFIIPKRSLFRLIEIGFGYEKFVGSELIQAARLSGSDLSYPEQIVGGGDFTYHRAMVRFSAQTVSMLGSSAYFHQGPGFFLDQTLKPTIEYDLEHVRLSEEAELNKSNTNVNYNVGIGFRLASGSFLDIYAHRPIISLDNDNLFDTSEEIFNSKFNKLFIGMRLVYLMRTPDRLCPNTGGGGRMGKKKIPSDFHPW